MLVRLAKNQRHFGLTKLDRVRATIFRLTVLGCVLLALVAVLCAGLILSEVWGFPPWRPAGLDLHGIYGVSGPAPMVLTVMLAIMRILMVVLLVRKSVQALPLQGMIVLVNGCLFSLLSFSSEFNSLFGYLGIAIDVALLYPLWMFRRSSGHVFAE